MYSQLLEEPSDIDTSFACTSLAEVTNNYPLSHITPKFVQVYEPIFQHSPSHYFDHDPGLQIPMLIAALNINSIGGDYPFKELEPSLERDQEGTNTAHRRREQQGIIIVGLASA